MPNQIERPEDVLPWREHGKGVTVGGVLLVDEGVHCDEEGGSEECLPDGGRWVDRGGGACVVGDSCGHGDIQRHETFGETWMMWVMWVSVGVCAYLYYTSTSNHPK